MQPFGLFSLLQTLMNNPQTTEPNPVEPTTDNPPPDPKEQAELSEDSSNPRQAILSFLDAHETRAQKTRKR